MSPRERLARKVVLRLPRHGIDSMIVAYLRGVLETDDRHVVASALLEGHAAKWRRYPTRT